MELDLQDGQLVEVVKTTRALELQELHDKVTAAQTVLDEINARKNTHDEQLAAIEAEVSAAQKTVDDSKSTVARGEELVGSTTTGAVDDGSEDSGVEATEGVETPADELAEVAL